MPSRYSRAVYLLLLLAVGSSVSAQARIAAIFRSNAPSVEIAPDGTSPKGQQFFLVTNHSRNVLLDCVVTEEPDQPDKWKGMPWTHGISRSIEPEHSYTIGAKKPTMLVLAAIFDDGSCEGVQNLCSSIAAFWIAENKQYRDLKSRVRFASRSSRTENEVLQQIGAEIEGLPTNVDTDLIARFDRKFPKIVHDQDESQNLRQGLEEMRNSARAELNRINENKGHPAEFLKWLDRFGSKYPATER
jgi:hypothetical protein